MLRLRPDLRFATLRWCVCGALAIAVRGLFAATDLASVGAGATLAEGVYYLNASRTLSGGTGLPGLAVAENAFVAVYLPEGVTLALYGSPAVGATAGQPGFKIPSSSTLILVGKGKLEAFGGDAAVGSDAADCVSDTNWDDTRQDGASTEVWDDYDKCKVYGGRGGAGGGGAGAGIGGAGGAGGSRGDCSIRRVDIDNTSSSHKDGLAGLDGASGGRGGTGGTMGDLYVLDAVAVEAAGGSFALGGLGGSSSERDSGSKVSGLWNVYGGSSGGGGGGGGGGAAAEIGGGGGGGGGGAAGGGGALILRGSKTPSYGDGEGGSGGAGGNGVDGDDGDLGTDGEGTRSSAQSYNKIETYGGTTGDGGLGGDIGGNGYLYLSEMADVPYGSPMPGFVETHIFLRRKITVDFAGGTSLGASATTVYAYLYLTMPEVPIPDRVGYIFRGYFTGQNGTGTQIYTDTGDALFDIWTLDGEDTRLYAAWENFAPPPDPLVVTRLDDAPFDPHSSNITFRAALTWAMMFPELTAPDGTKSKIVFSDALTAGKSSVEVALTSGVIRVGANRFTDHPLVLRGPGLTNCVIVVSGAKNGDRLLDIGDGNAVEIEGYTLRSGTSASDGGALWMRGGTLDARNCNFLNNAASGSGGAINAVATDFVRVENCRFEGNQTSAKSGGGGAIAGGKRLVVVNCSFRKNAGAYGGAIRSGESSVIVNSSFFLNSAWQTGGGVWSGGAKDHVTILNCTFEANIANCQENANANFDGGGGLYAQGGGTMQLDLVNCFLVGNRPATLAFPDVQFGERIATLNVYASMLGVANTQIVENARFNVRLGKKDRTFFEVGDRNMAYRQLTKGGVVHDYLRTVDTAGDIGYAVYHDADWANVALAATWGGAKAAICGTAAQATDLLLEDISSRDLSVSCTRSQGGSYWYVHDRPENGTIVTKIEDASDDYDGVLTLREIVRGITVNEAQWTTSRVDGVYTITFDERLRGGTFLMTEGGHLDIHGATTNDGVNIVVDGGDRGITIDGGGMFRAFAVRKGSSLTLKNLTFVNCVGAATSGGGYATGFDGGAVMNEGALVVSNCTFKACAGGPSFDEPIGFGGAICNGSGTNRATLAVFASTFENCRAARGGAVYTYDGGEATLDGCSFSDNRAASDRSVFVPLGGAIGAAKNASLTYSGCNFDDNTVVIDGFEFPDDVWRTSDRLHAIRYAGGELAVSIDALALPAAGSFAIDMSGTATMPDGSPAVTANPTGLRPGLSYGLGYTPDFALPFAVTDGTWVRAGADGSLPKPLRAPKGESSGFYKIFVRDSQ